MEIRRHVSGLLTTLLSLMEDNTDTYMPGFTHLQKAQPTTLAHHLGAYFEMFKRDAGRLDDCLVRMNYCPLGSGALAGTTYPLDRSMTASLLGFTGPTLNSMDSVSDRDYLIELMSALSLIMMHLSRFSEELITWNSNEYRFVGFHVTHGRIGYGNRPVLPVASADSDCFDGRGMLLQLPKPAYQHRVLPETCEIKPDLQLCSLRARRVLLRQGHPPL